MPYSENHPKAETRNHEAANANGNRHKFGQVFGWKEELALIVVSCDGDEKQPRRVTTKKVLQHW